MPCLLLTGNDTILDTDGQGSIVYNGSALTGGIRISSNYWRGANNVTYSLLTTGSSQDLLFDVNGNLVHTTVPMPYFADKIFDSTGDDNIYAGHGLNVIYAMKGGNNYIESGANDDYIVGGSGRDVVYSGGMSDTVDVAANDCAWQRVA